MTCKLINIKNISRIKALAIVISPFAKGLPLVRLTWESISLSQRSFAMQPKPLTNNPPAIINPTRLPLGGADGANHNDQPAGISRISLPLGLFQRSSCIDF